MLPYPKMAVLGENSTKKLPDVFIESRFSFHNSKKFQFEISDVYYGDMDTELSPF